MFKLERIGPCKLYLGDCAEVIPQLSWLDAVITDPPYASGGLSSAQRTKSALTKYTSTGAHKTAAPPEFCGDSLDQRLWARIISRVLKRLLPKLPPTAPFLFFIDWRQLPLLQDTLMLSGYPVRGVLVWDKGNTRPQHNCFSQSAEFIVWGQEADATARQSRVLWERRVSCAE